MTRAVALVIEMRARGVESWSVQSVLRNLFPDLSLIDVFRRVPGSVPPSSTLADNGVGGAEELPSGRELGGGIFRGKQIGFPRSDS